MLIKEAKLAKWGNSQGLRLSKDDLEEVGLTNESSFKMIVEKGKITLIPTKESPQTLDELFSEYKGEPLGSEDKFSWGEPIGRELF